MMKIVVKKSTLVKPSAETPNTSIWISKLDALMRANYHTRFMYFFRYNGEANFFDPEVLKAALSRNLVYFYPMAGRLKKVEGGVEINCNGEGALLVEAECDCHMDELGDFSPRPELAFTPAVDYSKGPSSFPISLSQVTRFKCGGVCLGMATHHYAVDGTSALHYINTWSDIARGFDITIPPFFDRKSVLSARDPPRAAFEHKEYQPPPTFKIPTQNPSSETIFSTFKLTVDQLKSLKAKCTGDDANAKYSTFEVVAGHAWRCVVMARDLPKEQDVRLHVLIDGRLRLNPPLPRGYFGNAIFHMKVGTTVGELESNPLSFAATKIREALERMDNEYLRSAIDHLELQPDIGTVSRNLLAMESPNMMVNSWVRLPFYDANFGWGRPVYVGPAVIPREGKTVLLQSPENDGSILYALLLPKQQMARFQDFFYEHICVRHIFPKHSRM